MPSSEELVAHGRTESEIEQMLGCDWLIYQDLADLEIAVAGPKHPGRKFDSSCFSGEYVTGIEPDYFERIRQLRSDDAKKSAASRPDAMASLFDAARACLDAATPDDKLARTAEAAQAFADGAFASLEDERAPIPSACRAVPSAAPGAPARTAAARLRFDEGRAAFIHAVAHIEFNAIDLAWDAVYRFRHFPAAYYADWIGVAADEARHFAMLRARLREFRPRLRRLRCAQRLVGDGEKTAHDALARHGAGAARARSARAGCHPRHDREAARVGRRRDGRHPRRDPARGSGARGGGVALVSVVLRSARRRAAFDVPRVAR
jgi:hypothetical protein